MKTFASSLRVIQRIVTIARSLAYQGTDSKEIAEMLDGADYLLALVISEEDPDEFKAYLEYMGERIPRIAWLADEFAKESGLTDARSSAAVKTASPS